MGEVFNNAVDYLWDIAKLGIIMWGILGFPRKFSKKGTLCLFLIMLACNLMANRIPIMNMRNIVMIVISIMAIFLNMKFLWQAFLCIPVYFLVVLLDLVTVILVLMATGKEPVGVIVTGSSMERWMKLISNSIIFFIYFCLWYFLGKKRKIQIRFIDVGISLFSAAAVFVFIEGFIFVIRFGIGNGKERYQELAMIGSLLVGFVFLLTVLYMFYIKNKNAWYKEQIRFSQEWLEYQKKYYESLLEKETETKRFRHDVMAHLNCVLGLLREERGREAKQYLESIEEVTGRLQKKVDTGNSILDFVVAYVMEEHEELLIYWKGAFPENVTVSTPDLCVLFSNLLKNSFEAQKRYQKETGKEKAVKVFIKNWENDLFVSIENNISAGEVFLGIAGKTGKPDKEHHGYGIYNITQIVKKYHGKIEYQQETEIVITQIYFENIIRENRGG